MLNTTEMNASNATTHPSEIIRLAIETNPAGPIIVSTNFRPQEAVILHMCTQIKPDIEVVWVDSGFMMEETYQFAEKVIKDLNLNIKVYAPLVTRARREALHGLATPGLDQPEALEVFAEEVKVEPFRRALAEIEPAVWFSGIRKEQNPFRQTLDIFSLEGEMLKVNPLFHWTDADMEKYLADNNLPNETIYFDPTKIDENRECGLHKAKFDK